MFGAKIDTEELDEFFLMLLNAWTSVVLYGVLLVPLYLAGA